MKSFREFLVEDRLPALKKKFSDIDTSHDAGAAHKTADAVVDHFANHADPSPNKQHTQWILQKYKQKDFRQEDAPRIKTALGNFDRYKSKLPVKDIGGYKKLSDVEDAVAPHVGVAAAKEETKRLAKHEGTDLVHKTANCETYHIKTKAAAQAVGEGTNWCTAHSEDEYNRFDYYHSLGPLYVHSFKNGRKFQSHAESSQLMDEKDNDFESNKEDVAKYGPELGQHLRAVGSSGLAIKAKIATKEDVHDYLNKHIASSRRDMSGVDGYTMRAALQSPHVDGDMLHKVMKSPLADHFHHYVNNPNFTDDHAVAEIKAMGTNNQGFISMVENRRQLSSEHYHQLLSDDKIPRIDKGSILGMKGIEQEHIDHGVQSALDGNKRSSFESNALKMTKNPEHFEHVMTGKLARSPNGMQGSYLSDLAHNPNTPSEHLHTIASMDHPAKDVLHLILAKNPNASGDTLHKIALGDNPDTQRLVAQHPNARPDTINHIAVNGDRDSRRAALQNKHASAESIDKAVRDPVAGDAFAAGVFNHRNMSDATKMHILNEPKYNLNSNFPAKQALARTGKLNDEHVQSILDSGDLKAKDVLSRNKNLTSDQVAKVHEHAGYLNRTKMTETSKHGVRPFDLGSSASGMWNATLKHPNASPEWLTKIADQHPGDMANNPNSPKEALDKDYEHYKKTLTIPKENIEVHALANLMHHPNSTINQIKDLSDHVETHVANQTEKQKKIAASWDHDKHLDAFRGHVKDAIQTRQNKGLNEDEGAIANSLGTGSMAADDVQLPLGQKLTKRYSPKVFAKKQRKAINEGAKNLILICEELGLTVEF